jgi:hypothetical protein
MDLQAESDVAVVQGQAVTIVVLVVELAHNHLDYNRNVDNLCFHVTAIQIAIRQRVPVVVLVPVVPKNSETVAPVVASVAVACNGLQALVRQVVQLYQYSTETHRAVYAMEHHHPVVAHVDSVQYQESQDSLHAFLAEASQARSHKLPEAGIAHDMPRSVPGLVAWLQHYAQLALVAVVDLTTSYDLDLDYSELLPGGSHYSRR